MVVRDGAGGEGGKGHGGGRRRGRRDGRLCACSGVEGRGLVLAGVGARGDEDGRAGVAGVGAWDDDGRADVAGVGARDDGVLTRHAGGVGEVVDLLLHCSHLLAEGRLDRLHGHCKGRRDDADTAHGAHAQHTRRRSGAVHAQAREKVLGAGRAAAQQNAQRLEARQVGAQAAVWAAAADIGGPQADVLVADAEEDILDVLGEGRGDDAEDVAVAGVAEDEDVVGVQHGAGLAVQLAAGAQQGRGDAVARGRRVRVPEGPRHGEHEGVDAVAQLAGQRQQQREGRVRPGLGRGRGGQRGVARARGREGDVGGRVEHGRVGRDAAGRGARGHGGREGAVAREGPSAGWWEGEGVRGRV